MGGDVERESKRMRRARGARIIEAGKGSGGQLWGASNSSTFARAGPLTQLSPTFLLVGIPAVSEFQVADPSLFKYILIR